MRSKPRLVKRFSLETKTARRLGRKIKALRMAQHISQLELAERSENGLYRQLIIKIESGKYLPNILQIRAIAKTLNQSVIDWLKEILEL